jgi:hypothetical protein
LGKDMESKYAIIVSIVLGGLLGFSLTYAVLTNQISALKTTLNNIENELADTNVTIQNINNSVLANFRSVNEDLVNLNVSIDDLQDSLSAHKAQTQTQMSILTSSITNNVALLQQQIDDMKIEWEFIGSWRETTSFSTVSFMVRNELWLQWYMDGKSWDSYVYIRIYYENGTFYDAVGSSGWLAANYADIYIKNSGTYYFDIQVYMVNDFFVNAWTYK